VILLLAIIENNMQYFTIILSFVRSKTKQIQKSLIFILN